MWLWPRWHLCVEQFAARNHNGGIIACLQTSDCRWYYFIDVTVSAFTELWPLTDFCMKLSCVFFIVRCFQSFFKLHSNLIIFIPGGCDGDSGSSKVVIIARILPVMMQQIHQTRTVSFEAIFEAKRQRESCVVFKEVRCKRVPPKIVSVLPQNLKHMSLHTSTINQHKYDKTASYTRSQKKCILYSHIRKDKTQSALFFIAIWQTGTKVNKCIYKALWT